MMAGVRTCRPSSSQARSERSRSSFCARCLSFAASASRDSSAAAAAMAMRCELVESREASEW